MDSNASGLLPVLITRVAFTLTLALVIARALMTETIRSGFNAVHVGQATEYALADMLVAIESARALTYQATCAVAESHASAARVAVVSMR